MAVVINEFEVVAEEPPASQSAKATPGGTTAPPSPSAPHDIERIIRRQIERSARVRAH